MTAPARTWWPDRSAVAAACGIVALVFAAVIAARSAGLLQALELQAYDRYLRLHASAAAAGAAEPRIVLVTVAERDLERYGWPLGDDVLARLLDRLTAYGPRAIGVDLFRDRPVAPRQRPMPAEAENDLNEVLRSHEEIVTIIKFPGADGVRVEPPPAVADDPRRFGFVDIPVDPDGIVRRGLLYLDDGTDFQSSFALRLALLYLRPHGIAEAPDALDPLHLRLGRTTYVPLEPDDGGYVAIDARGYQYLLTYPMGAAPLPALTLTEALDGADGLEWIRDRLVLVGTTAESVKDLFFSPLAGADGDQRMHGVTLHAQMAGQLIRQALGEGRPIRILGQGWEAAWIGLWCALGGIAALLLRAPVHLIAAAAGGIVLLVGLTYPAFAHGWWLPVLPPLLGGLAAMSVTIAHISRREQRQRSTLMRLFSTYVSPGVAEELWAQRDAFLEPGGRPRPQLLTATVLFSDIRGFTTVSEVLPPEELVPWLNEYMEAMAGLVMAYGGIVEKFAGDGITATFGVPVPRTTEAEISRDAQNAACCALAMADALARLNRTYEARQLPAIGIRVGINTGPLVVGSIGSAQRLQYSIIGDTANTAARLESYDRDAVGPADGCRILISEATYRCLGSEHEVEPVGSLRLKGKAKPITVYRLLRAAKPKALPRPEKETVNGSYRAGLSVVTQAARRALLGRVWPHAARRGGRGAAADGPGAGSVHDRSG